MKKNKMMRLASAMMVLTLMSTSVISGTFAKYVTTGSGSDKARVAKWGVEFTIGSDLFDESYTYKTAPNGAVTGTLSVKSAENVVAPGTQGTGYSFTTKGTPEVSYEVSFDVDNATAKTVFLRDYYPVKFKLSIGGHDIAISDTVHNVENIMAAIEKCKYMYDVHTEKYYVSGNGGAEWVEYGSTAPALELSWDWAYHTSADNDVLDTQLGNLAAGVEIENPPTEGQYSINIDLTVAATATQID